jgi:signal transduction histidine kinase
MSESDLTVKIADNGRGFDDGKENAKRSGLTHIRERLAEIGGRCEVRSELGRGTVIQLLLPLNLPTRYDPSQEGSRH